MSRATEENGMRPAGRRWTWVSPPKVERLENMEAIATDRQKVMGRVERSQEVAHYKCRNPARIPDSTEMSLKDARVHARLPPGETGTIRGHRVSHSHPALAFVGFSQAENCSQIRTLQGPTGTKPCRLGTRSLQIVYLIHDDSLVI